MDWGPSQFEPKEVTDTHRKGNPRNETQKIEENFWKDNAGGCSNSEKVSLEDIKQLNKKAVESEEEKVTGEFTEALTRPRTVGSKDGAGCFGKNRARYSCEKSGEE